MLIAQLQKEFNDELPGVDFNFSQYIQDNVEEALSGVKGANSVKIIGRDLPTIERLATAVMQQMQRVKGITDLGIFHVLGQPNLNIKVNREKAARYGLNTGDVNTVVQAALGGTPPPRCSRAIVSLASWCGCRRNIARASKRRAISRSAIRRRTGPTRIFP